uniref:Macro domain-containing protein n=1 Tax=Eutreptiella gymnastica TaxID=73025 RepID=A0A7S1IPL0_9EUGL|mmetsp:Transcript_32142/g.57654  ORF Transcript_32142/g.57654 Transcript_32142/m.57654 type:complete len:536 (+) Transcript_32142:129-1736(+)
MRSQSGRLQHQKNGPSEVEDPLAEETNEEPSKFPYREDLNDIVSLWQGRICSVECDAIVNAAEEYYNDRRHPLSETIFRLAGPSLDLEVTQIALESNPNNSTIGCRTGDAIITNAYLLPCSKVIHTVGPRYNEKYRTAAENMLHSCYRTCLQTLVENDKSTIIFTCIHSERKNYTLKDGAPVALRTVRRFLERYPGKVKHVVFAMQSAVEHSFYYDQMKLYFPRSKAEERTARHLLPSDTGNEIGEIVCPERQIRIGTAPTHNERSTTSLDFPKVGLSRDHARTTLAGSAHPAVKEGEIDTKAVAKPASSNFGRVSVITGSSALAMTDEVFCGMQGDVDARKKEAVNSAAQDAMIIYGRYIRKAATTDLSHIESWKAIYKCGLDIAGRQTVALVGCRIPAAASWSELLLYFIKLMDVVVNKEYTLVYFHYNLGSRPEFGWLRRIYKLLPQKYKDNLKAVYLIHPTWWLNLGIAFVRPFVSDRFWLKVYRIYDLRQLYSYVPPESIKVPDLILQYNQSLYGDAPATSTAAIGREYL